MRRRFLCYVLCAVMVLSLAACGKDGNGSENPAGNGTGVSTDAQNGSEKTKEPEKPKAADAAAKIEFESYVEAEGTTTEDSNDEGAGSVVGLGNGNYAAYNVDLGDGGYEQISVRYASAVEGGKVEIRYTAADGDLVGTIDLPATAGSDQFETVTVDVPDLKSFGRKKVLYFVYSGEDTACKLNWFHLYKISDGKAKIDFENYADAISGLTSEDCKEEGKDEKNIGGIKNNYWSLYKINFGEGGYEQLVVRASSEMEGGSLEVHIGSLESDPIGKFDITGTGGWHNWETFTFDIPELAEITDTQDVYMVYNDGGDWLYNLNWFRLYKAALPAYARVEAEDFFEATCGAENCAADGTMNLGGVTPGKYAAYQIDFEDGGYTHFKVRASSPMSGGDIIMHKDSLDGEVVCVVTVGNKDVYGADWGNYGDWDFDTPELAALTGKQILFFEFNNSPENSSHLFNINWYEFTK